MSNEPAVKRWTTKRKAAVVMDIFKGKTTVDEVAQQHDLTVSEVEGWIEETHLQTFALKVQAPSRRGHERVRSLQAKLAQKSHVVSLVKRCQLPASFRNRKLDDCLP